VNRITVLWLSDFTFVATWSGFVYVAFVIDAYARRIVGWRASRTPHAGVVLDALEQVTGTQVTILAPLANSTIEGAGYDVLDLSHNPIASASSAYSLTSNGNGSFTLATTGSSDNVSGVEQVKFSDENLTVAASNSMNEYVALLYQGALGRTPDAAGLAFWETFAATLPASIQAFGIYALADASGIAGGFMNSSEFISKYGNSTNTQFVTQLYANILDRSPDAAGLNYWMTELNSGLSRQTALVGFADSTEAISNATHGFTGQSGAHAAWLFLT
jgi:hypothetical protein